MRFAFATALLGLVMLLHACRTTDEGPALKIGTLIPLTGELADSSIHMEGALIMAGEQINQAGGIGGLPVRFVVRDTHSNPAHGEQAARELLADPSILALL